MDIVGKTAVVTGGASGLGRATAIAYARKGARVAIFDLDQRQGNLLVQRLGDTVSGFWSVDVADESSVKHALESVVSRFGEIHICNNFAGIGSGCRTIGKQGVHSLGIFQQVINVNLVGTFNVARFAASHMARNKPINEQCDRGVIINTASIAAFEGQIGQVAYSGSKCGVIAMTLPMARDLAEYGIRVNTIVPGLIRTPLIETLPPHQYSSLEQSVSFPQRLGRPEEIAHLSVFMAENDYLNGACIRIDGAIRMKPI